MVLHCLRRTCLVRKNGAPREPEVNIEDEAAGLLGAQSHRCAIPSHNVSYEIVRCPFEAPCFKRKTKLLQNSDLRKWFVANTRHSDEQKNTYKTITYACQIWFCGTCDFEIVAQENFIRERCPRHAVVFRGLRRISKNVLLFYSALEPSSGLWPKPAEHPQSSNFV